MPPYETLPEEAFPLVGPDCSLGVCSINGQNACDQGLRCGQDGQCCVPDVGATWTECSVYGNAFVTLTMASVGRGEAQQIQVESVTYCRNSSCHPAKGCLDGPTAVWQ